MLIVGQLFACVVVVLRMLLMILAGILLRVVLEGPHRLRLVHRFRPDDHLVFVAGRRTGLLGQVSEDRRVRDTTGGRGSRGGLHAAGREDGHTTVSEGTMGRDEFCLDSRRMETLKKLIKDVPDFPKPGIVYKDFTPLLADPAGLALAVELMANPYRGVGVDVVVGAESRGFIFGIAVAQSLSAGFVPVRKAGKLPRAVKGVQYALEYGTDRLEMHSDALVGKQRVLLVDDLLATGGTLEACARLVHEAAPQATLVGASVLIELGALGGIRKLGHCGRVHSVIKY